MRAIVLAAGEGTRLRPYTLDRPKCLVELGGKPLLVHQVEALETAGVEAITVVTGYRADQIEALGYRTAHNPDYATTNMVTTLMCAAELLDGAADVVIAYADLVYEPRVVRRLLACGEPLCTTVDSQWRRLWELRLADPLSDAETLKLSAGGDIVELGKKPSSYDEIQGQYMGLIKVRADLAPELVAHHRRLDPSATYDGKDLANMYMTSFLQDLIDHGHRLRAVPVDGGWLEVDTIEDLELYRRLHAEGRLADYCRLDGETGIEE
jgi:choline kinase